MAGNTIITHGKGGFGHGGCRGTALRVKGRGCVEGEKKVVIGWSPHRCGYALCSEEQTLSLFLLFFLF